MSYFYQRMQRSLCRMLLAIGLLSGLVFQSQASTLSAGGIFFMAVSTDLSDDFSFVLLQPISGTTVIRFTDNAYNPAAPGAWASSEGYISWTYVGSLPAGTQVAITNTSTATPGTSHTSAG